MYFADNSMQGMDMSSHVTTSTHAVPKVSFATHMNNTLQKPTVAFTLVTLAILTITLLSFWLLKRFTTWQFPNNKRG